MFTCALNAVHEYRNHMTNSKVWKVPQPFSSNEFYHTSQSASKWLAALYLLMFGGSKSILETVNITRTVDDRACLCVVSRQRMLQRTMTCSDNEIICGGSYKDTHTQKRQGNTQSHCQESVCIYASDMTSFSEYAYVPHLLPPRLSDKARPSSPRQAARSQPFAFIAFFAGSRICL